MSSQFRVYNHTDPDYPRIVASNLPTSAVQFVRFSGGEPHINIVDGIDVYNATWGKQSITAHITSMDDLGFLWCLVDIFKTRWPRAELNTLFIPYFPGGRADRGSPMTVKMYADIINSFGFNQVLVTEPHSYVIEALTRCDIAPLSYITKLSGHFKYYGGAYDHPYSGVISPDAGAMKRSQDCADVFSLPVYTATKKRNPNTGKLSDVVVPDGLDQFGYYVVFDDICDGGATFIQLAQALREQYPNIQLDLVVAHGIFSKGTDELLDYYNAIYSTTSFLRKEELETLNVKVI